MTNLAKIIKKRREYLKISQGKLGALLGFQNGQFISNIELKDIQYPPKYYNKISKFLHIQMKDILKASMKDYKEWLEIEIKKGK